MTATSILDHLNEFGDSIEGKVVSTEPSERDPSHYGILTLDNGLSVDLDYADNLRREVDGILDSYYEDHPEGDPTIRITRIDPGEITREDKDFKPSFAHAVTLIEPEGD